MEFRIKNIVLRLCEDYLFINSFLFFTHSFFKSLREKCFLTRWNETSPNAFLEETRNGFYKNAENDAIEVHQLITDAQKLRKQLSLSGFSL